MPLLPAAIWFALGLVLLVIALLPNGIVRLRWPAALLVLAAFVASLALAWGASPQPFAHWQSALIFDDLAHLLLPPVWTGVTAALLVTLFLTGARYELAIGALSAAVATAGILSANPLLTVFLLQAGAVLVLAGLVVYSHRTEANPLLSVATALKFITLNVVGAACLVMALLLSTFYALNQDRLELPRIIAAVFVVGFGLAAGAMPFYFHYPDVFDAAPSLVTTSLIGPLQCLAFVYLVRTAGNGPWLLADNHVVGVLVFGALGGSVLAALLTFGQRTVNRVLAFNAIRETGWIVFGIASATVLGWTGALTFLAARTVSGPLLLAAVAFFQNHSVKLEGTARLLPIATFGWCVGVLATVGIPPAANFWGLRDLFRSSLVFGSSAPALLLLSALLALWRFGRLTATVFSGSPDAGTEREPAAPSWVLGSLGFGILFAGVVPRLFQVPVDHLLGAFAFLR